LKRGIALRRNRCYKSRKGVNPRSLRQRATGRSLFCLPISAVEVQSVSDIAQPQLHTHLEKRGKPVRLEAGTCPASDTRSRVALGYLVFRGTDRSWPMPQSTTAAKAWDAVSNPTEPQHQKTAGVNQARLPREAEKGSIPSHTTEQIEKTSSAHLQRQSSARDKRVNQGLAFFRLSDPNMQRRDAGRVLVAKRARVSDS
jgi:hypothetical protein